MDGTSLGNRQNVTAGRAERHCWKVRTSLAVGWNVTAGCSERLCHAATS